MSPFDANRTVLPAWWTWGLGALVGMVVLGPALGAGSLLSLDLLVTPSIPIPNGVFGLGPALSQRVPLFAVFGVLSTAVGGPVAVKLAMVALVAAGFAGAARLCGPAAGPLTRVAAGLLWAAGPFALTRIGAGHLNLVWAIGVLPWALPRLCRPSDAPWATFLAAGAVAFGGPGSGTLGVAVALLGLATERARRPVAALGAVVAANLVWVLPTAVLLWAGAGVQGSGGFETQEVTWGRWPAVLAGNGFWRADHQVGLAGPTGVVAGLVVAALAVVGRREVAGRWARTASLVAVVGLALALASGVPGVQDAYGWVSDLPVGAPLRESGRFLTLWLVWAASCAANGGAVLARRLRPAAPDGSARSGGLRSGLASLAAVVPLVLAVAVSVGGWWGVQGRLDPVAFPSGWAEARAIVEERPGTVVNLPWSEYPTLSFAQERTVFNPMPDYLGGDVISSYDPLFDLEVPSQEQVDGRAVAMEPVADRVVEGIPISRELGELGVRWVVVVHEDDWEDYGSLARDPGLRQELALPDLDLFEVTAWAGEATAPDGRGRRLDRPVPPVLTTDAPEGSVLNVAGAPGWIQGWATPASVTDDGRLRLEGSGGVVWFAPALVLLAVDVALLAAVVVAVRRSRSDGWGRRVGPPLLTGASDPLVAGPEH